MTPRATCSCSLGSVVMGHTSLPPSRRPLSTQNCWTDVCGVHWRVSLWTVCTATCGNYGFQSRRVDCVHVRTNKPVLEHHCSWRPRPVNWQRCNITPCENGTLLRGGEAARRRGEERRQSRLSEMQHWTLQLGVQGNLQPEHVQNAVSKTQRPKEDGAHCGLLPIVLALGLCPLANSM